MTEYSFITSNLLICCYYFVFLFIMITVGTLLKDKKRLVVYLSWALLIVACELGHAVFTKNLVDGILPLGRFIFVGVIAFIFGPIAGLIAGVSNIALGTVFGFEHLLILSGTTFIYYIVFVIYGEVAKNISKMWGITMMFLPVFFAALLSYVYSILEPNPIRNISEYPTYLLLTGWALQYLLLIGASYIKYREEMTIRTNADLEMNIKMRTKELENLNRGLEDEVKERRHMEDILKKTQQEAIYANKAKTEFLANMSHEIRTPINAIMGFNYLLGNTELSTQQRSYLDKANDSSEHLLNVINDILDFSKIEADQMTLHPTKVSLYMIINSVFDKVMYSLYSKNLSMNFLIDKSVPEYCLIDGNKLQQILLNLISNAIKFTEQGRITVGVKMLEEGEKRLYFTVTDTGIGISSSNQEKLFDAFSQVEGTITRRYGGTGLGLSISKSLVELMGGSIEVNSTLGRGSSFVFNVAVEQVYSPPNLSVNYRMKIALIQQNSFEESLVANQIRQMGVTVILFDVSSMSLDDFYADSFDQIIVECVDQMDFGSEWVKKFLTTVNEAEKISILTYYRFSGMHRYVEMGLVRGMIISPIGSEQLYHHLISTESLGHIRKNQINNDKYKGVKVLLVEDNNVNQLVCKEILMEKGIEVMVADDGLEAIRMVEETPFDLILMDIHMPIMDGLEATSRIREIEKAKDLPIIAMTADTMVDKGGRYEDSGLTDFILKPINVKEMFIVIDQHLKTVD